jgi:hypothetical protein
MIPFAARIQIQYLVWQLLRDGSWWVERQKLKE